MIQAEIDLVLQNYTQFLEKVDAHIQRVEKKYPEEIACKKGCDSCCRFLTLFPVEAFSISAAFLKLDKPRQDFVRSVLVPSIPIKNGPVSANEISSGLNPSSPVPSELEKKGCPLLINRECILYEARPIICRTHGFPIYIEKDGESLVDFCPKNFKNNTSFSRDTLLHLEQLNTLLTAINTQFLKSIELDSQFPDRIPISQALFMLCGIESSCDSRKFDPKT